MHHGAYSVHPHCGMETVTYAINGVVDHPDSAGHLGWLGPGDAQWMTAGRGHDPALDRSTWPECHGSRAGRGS